MTPRVQAPDAAARERIRTSLGESLIVEASAGTGKTSEIVRRIVNVLAAGTRVQEIVAVTFTHKAAGELKIRLRQGLDEAREAAEPTEKANLEHALAHLEEAAVGTIHSFCAQILHERPVEARVDPEFGEMTEQESARLFDRAFDQWFQARLDAPSPGLRRALARLSWRDGWDTGPPLDQLKYAGRKLLEWRDFPAAWERKPFERVVYLDALHERVIELADLARKARRKNDALAIALRPAVDVTERMARARTQDYDTLEALLLKLERDLKRDRHKGSGVYAEGILREGVLEARESLLHSLNLFRQCADADLAAELRAEMGHLVDRYMALKAQSGKLDFLDLLLMVRDLVRDNSEVRNWLQQRFQRIFIDEFQDTDPLQAEILVLLSADDPAETNWNNVRPIPGKLFVVGDPKQSIYKFRRADVALYQKICEALESRGVVRLTLTTSYRSVRSIQEFVNAAFEPEMTGDAASSQSRYSPLEEHEPAYANQPAVIALPAPRPYGARRIAKTEIDKCLPDATAAFVEWLVRQSGWTVRDLERTGERVPLEARHICVLFRRFTNFGADVTRNYVRALEARGLPHLLVGSRSFHKREEVETLRAALTAIEWPEDELSVFATLKGTLFAISDDVLLRFRHDAGPPLHPFRPIPTDLDPELQPMAEALSVLRDLHRLRNRRPLAETVNLLLEAARAHAGFALRPAGVQVLANVYRVCDLARAFETGGGISFRGFVEELTRQAERSDSAEAPVLEEASDGVRLMTVHTAKGLEFPVVILADMTANIAAAEPDRLLDADRKLCATRLLRCAPWELLDDESPERERERAEGVRVAYVAATRARDLIVVPVVGDEERDGWLAPLNKAVYPAPRDCRNATKAPGCPAFKADTTVLNRPIEYSNHGEVSVKPGLHRARSGGHAVVWWDPASLRLNVPENFGLHQEEILAAEPADRANESVRQYHAWVTDRAHTQEAGARPRLRILTPSDTTTLPPVDIEVSVESTTRAEGRPAGRLFGVLVHAILRDATEPDRIPSLARLHGRLLRLSPGEVEAAAQAATAALNHPVFERARRASRFHRELPLTARLEDGVLLEGIADLAFLDNGAWTAVDFKTDAWLAPAQARYERQLRWYAYALSRVTGQPARALLLRV